MTGSSGEGSSRLLTLVAGLAERRFLRSLSIVLDLAVILVVAFFFIRPVLNFDDMHQPSQTDDWQDITSGLQLFRQSVLDHGELPMWNPNFGSGTPFIAEPKTFIFNPLASAPALIWDVYDGPKISMLLSVAVAGLGMYYLTGTLGASRPWRVWAGLTMAMCGGFSGHIFAGHFEFVLGLALLPMLFALNIDALRRPGVAFCMLAGLVNAVLFFSGHALFTVYAMPGLVLTFAFVAADEAFAARDRWPAVVRATALRALQIVAWTLGIAAIQFVPAAASISHFDAPKYNLEGAETIPQSFDNFYITDVEDLGPDPAYPYWGFWEYYYYVGFVPLIGLPFLVLAFWQRRFRMGALWATTLFGLYMCWAAAPHTFFRWIYDAYDPLYQFRVPSRALNFATPLLIAMAALGFSALTDTLRPHVTRQARTMAQFARFAGAAAAFVVLAGLAVYGVRDIYGENGSLINGRLRFPDQREVIAQLNGQDTGMVYVQAPLLGQAVPPAFYQLGAKRIDAAWEYGYRPPDAPAELQANIPRRATYIIGGADLGIPNPNTLGKIGDWYVARQPDAPPYASTLPLEDRPNGDEYQWALRATPAQVTVVSANVIEVRATTSEQERLLLLEYYGSGWRLEIDGDDAPKPDNFAGYLSTPALSGPHTYTFVYDPEDVRFGAAVTAGTLLGGVFLLGWRVWNRRYRRRSDHSCEIV